MATRIDSSNLLPLVAAGGAYMVTSRFTSHLMRKFDEQDANLPTSLMLPRLSNMAYLKVLNQGRLASVDRSLDISDGFTSRLITHLQVLSMLSSCLNTENAEKPKLSKGQAAEVLVFLEKQQLAGAEFEEIKSSLKKFTEEDGPFNLSVSNNVLDDFVRRFAAQCKSFWHDNKLNREHFKGNSLTLTARQIIELSDPSQLSDPSHLSFKVFKVINPSGSFPGLHVWSDDQLKTIIDFLQTLKSKVQESTQFLNVEKDINTHITLFQQILGGATEVSETGFESFKRIFSSFAGVYKNELPANFAYEVDSSIETWSEKFQKFEESQLTTAQKVRQYFLRSENFSRVFPAGVAGLVYSMMTTDLFREQ